MQMKIDNCPECNCSKTGCVSFLDEKDIESYYIECDKCLFRGPRKSSKEKAIIAWNYISQESKS